jgi:hypothetical protein
MQSHNIFLKTKSENITLWPFSCLHIGSTQHDNEKAINYRDYVLNTKDAYAMSLGDDCENALPGDDKHNSMMWQQNMNPQEQFDAACEYWRPLVESGKLLLTADSNHFYRSEMKTGISIAKQMNIFLGNIAQKAKTEPPKWGRWSAFLKLHVNKQQYLVHATHGSGGGTTPESALKKCRETASYIHADLYVRGHHHKLIHFSDAYFDWTDGGPKPVERKRVFACTGCFLRWDESYGERMGLPPGLRGACKVTLSSKRHDIRVGS